MKARVQFGLRHMLYLVTCLMALMFFAVAPSFESFVGAALLVFVVGNLLSRACGSLFATLTTTEILADTMDAFRTFVPMINAFSTDFSNARSKKGETIIAHVSSLPVVQDYDANSGFELN